MARRPARSAAKNNRIISLDFTGVEVRQTVPEGEYAVEVMSVESGTSENDNPKLDWKFEVIDEGKYQGATLYYTTSLVPQALWKLHSLLSSLGVEVPDAAMDLDLDEMVGAQVMAVVQHEIYQNKTQARMVDFYEMEGAAEPEPEPAKGRRGRAEADAEAPAERGGRRAGKGKTKEPELSPLEAEEVQGMSEDELASVVEDYELDVELGDFRTLRKKAAAVIDALDAKEMLAAEEPEPEPEPEPAPRGRRAAAEPAEEPTRAARGRRAAEPEPATTGRRSRR